jgi:hypothetical protein
MAILSSLFGASQQQPAVGAQPIQSAEIPTELKPYYTDILGKAQALYNKRVEEGFKPYEGPTIAQFTPEQQATFTGIAGLQGQVAPKFAEAEQLTRDAAAQITGAQIQEAMSPYQQAVTDIEKRESQKAFEQNVLPKIRAAQVAQGSFGGTRGTLLEAQALADQQRGLADIQAKGSAAAFTDARRALETERTRMGQGATQLANIAPAALKTGLAELGAQQTVGETKQRQAQTALDEAYRQFLQEKQEPYEAMQKYQAVVTGAPLTTTQFAPPPAPGPSLGQTLIGGLGTAAGLYGAFTGQNPLAAVGLAKGQTGGGISDLMPDFPVIQAQQGTENLTLGQRLSGRFQDILGDTSPIAGTMGLQPVQDRVKLEDEEDNLSIEDALIKQQLQQQNLGVDDFGGVTEAIRKNKERERLIEAQKNKPVQGPSLPEGGLSSLKKGTKADQPPAPTKAQLREQAIRAEEEGLKSLYGQYAQRAETEKAESKDSEYRAQMANMAKAFAQFATKGGEGNILQKAIGTAGDNVDAFVGTSDKFRKERKAIEKDLQKGELAEARLKYDVTKDRASRELSEEQRKLAAEKLAYDRKAAAATAAEDKRRFGLKYGLDAAKLQKELNEGKELDLTDLGKIEDIALSVYGLSKTDVGTLIRLDGEEVGEIPPQTLNDIKEFQTNFGKNLAKYGGDAYNIRNVTALLMDDTGTGRELLRQLKDGEIDVKTFTAQTAITDKSIIKKLVQDI